MPLARPEPLRGVRDPFAATDHAWSTGGERYPSDRPVVLLPSYAPSQPNLTPLLALWLGAAGVRVLVHGRATAACTTAAVLADLGLPPAQGLDDILEAWHRRRPAYVPLARIAPRLEAAAPRDPAGTAIVASLLQPVAGARCLRLAGAPTRPLATSLARGAARTGADMMLLADCPGDPVCDPRRQPRIDTWIGGRWRIELSAAERRVAPPDWPLLPEAADAASTAVFVQSVLSGERPAPPSLLRQIDLIEAAVASLETATVHHDDAS